MDLNAKSLPPYSDHCIIAVDPAAMSSHWQVVEKKTIQSKMVAKPEVVQRSQGDLGRLGRQM